MNHSKLGSTELLESLFAHVSDAILVVDREGNISGLNPAFEKLTGWSADELIGKMGLCEVCVGMATCSEEVTCLDCFTTRLQMPSYEMRVRTKAGVEVAVTASSTRLPEESESALVLILRDYSEMQRMERERHQRQLTSYVIRAQEEERKRISRDLHDGVGQALYSIMVGLKVVNQLELDPMMKEHLDEVQKLTVQTLDEVKTMSVELRPSALDDLGLVPALRSYLRGFSQTFGIEADFTMEGARRRHASEIETALYRIAQEALTNAAKYSGTERVNVRLIDAEDRVELELQDFGSGFDLEHLHVQGTGLGLYGMVERAELLGGRVEIDTMPGRGTRIHAVIPAAGEAEGGTAK